MTVFLKLAVMISLNFAVEGYLSPDLLVRGSVPNGKSIFCPISREKNSIFTT